jgi:hypothetical protein
MMLDANQALLSALIGFNKLLERWMKPYRVSV